VRRRVSEKGLGGPILTPPSSQRLAARGRWKVRLFWIRFKIFFHPSRWAFLLIVVWFACGTLAFYRVERLPFPEALLTAVYLREHRSPFFNLYSFWGQCVLFGIFVSVFLLQALQQYNPAEACRMLAKEMKDHVVIIGHSHLGMRIVEHLRQIGRPYVVVDKNPMSVDDLVRHGEPVIVDDAKESSTLESAGIERASVVVVASNNIETALLVTKRARERNQGAAIVVRCFQDEFAEILEGLGATAVISSSKSAFSEIASHLPAPFAPPH